MTIKKVLPLLLTFFIIFNCFNITFASAIIYGSSDGTYVDFADYAYNSAILAIGSKTYAFEAVRFFGIKVVDITNPNTPVAVTVTNEGPYKALDTVNDPYHSVCARTEGADSYIYTMLSYNNTVDPNVAVGTTQFKIRRIKVTDPTNPVLIAEYTAVDLNYSRDIKVEGGYIYTAGASVSIFDAKLTSGIGASVNNRLSVISTKLYSFEKQGDYIYGVDYTLKGFKIIKTASSPGTTSFNYTLLTKSLTSYLPNNATLRGVAVIGNYAYVCSSDTVTEANNKVFVIDISVKDDKASFEDATKGICAFKPDYSILTPTYSSSSNTTWFRPYSIQADGNLLYITDYNKRIWVYDVTDNATSPKIATNKQLLTKKAYSLTINGSNLFVSSEGDKRLSVYPTSNICISSLVENEVVKLPIRTISGTSRGGNIIKLTIGTGATALIIPDANGNWSYSPDDIPNGDCIIVAKLYNGETLLTGQIKNINVDIPDIYFSKPVFTDQSEKVNISFTGSNMISINKDVCIIAALYKGSKLVRVASKSVHLTGSTKEIPMSIDLNTTVMPEDSFLSEYTVKTFVWDDLNNVSTLLSSPYTRNYPFAPLFSGMVTNVDNKKIVMCYPNGKAKALTFSYDDGKTLDKTLVALFNKYNLKATFNISSGKIGDAGYLTSSEITSLFSGHEVASHGMEHVSLTSVTTDAATVEIVQSKEDLSNLVGYSVRGIAYPYGGTNNTIDDILRTNGYVYARGVGESNSFIFPTIFIPFRGTCQYKTLNTLPDQFVELNKPDELSLFYIWGHSIDLNLDWVGMEAFCIKVSNRADVWYATNIEIFDYYTALKTLQVFKGSSLKIYNPSNINVWIKVEGNAMEIPAMQTVTI